MNTSKNKLAFAAFSFLVVGGMLISSSASAQVGYGGKGGIGGGGGSGSIGCFQSIIPPVDGFSVRVNSENGSVFSRSVSLTINGGNARRMAISNDAAFTNASLETANNTKEWTLSEGEGAKTVFVRFYDECGIATSAVSATVNLRAARTASDEETASADGQTTEGQVLGEKISQVDELIARLTYGRRNADVLVLQNELVRLGLMPRGWRSTNYYGPVTLAAVTRYVDAHNGNLDEMIGRLRFGQTHPDVRRLSRQLIAGGFMPKGTRITSYYGAAVRTAVAKYNASR